MTKVNLKPNSEKLADVVVSAIHEKKGQKISLLDLRSLNNSLCDFSLLFWGTAVMKMYCNYGHYSLLFQKYLAPLLESSATSFLSRPTVEISKNNSN